MQTIAGGSLPQSRVWLTPQRAGFGFCGAMPTKIGFFSIDDKKDVMDVRSDSGVKNYTSLFENNASVNSLPTLPCPGLLPMPFNRPLTVRTIGIPHV